MELLSFFLVRFWSMFSNFLFVPVYVYLIGLDGYAIFALSSTFSLFFAIFDAGFSPAITRKFSVTNDSIAELRILSSFEITVLRRSFVSLMFSFVFYMVLLRYDLFTSNIWQDPVIILVIAVNAISTLPCNLLRAALIGIHKGSISNLSLVLYGTLKHFVSFILLIAAVDVFYIFLSHILISILYRSFLTKFLNAHVSLQIQNGSEGSNEILKSEDTFLKTMVKLSIISAIISQTEKIVGSVYLSDAEFASYFTLSMLAVAPFYVALPAFQYSMPKILQNVELKILGLRTVELLHISVLISVVTCLLNAAFIDSIFYLWMRIEINGDQKMFFCLYTLGTVLLILQLYFYFAQMLKGDMTHSLQISYFVAPLTISIFPYSFGSEIFYIYAVPWVVLNAIVLFWLSVKVFRDAFDYYFKRIVND